MWTFGICYSKTTYIDRIIKSIHNQAGLTPNNFEIILIGPSKENLNHHGASNIKNIVFEESIRPAWITLKKNLIVQNAKFENICITHDYVGFCENWFIGYEKFGYDWDVCMNPVRMENGLRHRDWFTQHRPLQFVNYNDITHIKEMYINGTYWCGKKKFMLENPQNNNLCWGQGEDVEWGLRCQKFWNYKLNPYSVVKYMKTKELLDWNPHPDIDPNKNSGYEAHKIQE
jgi:hypothetical protein